MKPFRALYLRSLGSGDPFLAQVRSLLFYAGTNGSTTFTDQIAGRTWTDPSTPQATISTSHALYGYSSCGSFSGTAGTNESYISTSSSFAFSSGDWTIEMFVYLTALPPTQNAVLFDSRPTGLNGFYPTWALTTAGFLTYSTNNATVMTQSSGAITLNRWVHVALCKSGSTIRQYMDGVQVGSATDTNTYVAAGGIIGGSGFNQAASSRPLNGFIGASRVTLAARYTTAFIPPTSFASSRAACTITHGVTLNDTTDGAVNTLQNYTTGAFTPAANDLLVVCVEWITTGTNAGSVAVSNSAGLTFTQVVQRAATSRQVLVFVADALAANSSQTVTVGCTPTGGANAAGCNVTVLRVAGMAKTSSAAVRQVPTPSSVGATNTPAPSFATAASTNNPCIGVVANLSNPAGMTEPSGWTEFNDSGFATPSAGLETVGIASGFTGTTVTWGSTTATAALVAILELDNT